jgi:cell division cycle 20-like protein 1 (cofactor of APC complex)
VYSDRFIPSRATSSRLDFSVLDRETAASEAPKRPAEREEANGAYNLLLRSELLGCPSLPSSPEKAPSGQASPMRSPTRKMFRFMSGGDGASRSGEPTASPFSRGPVGEDDPTAPSTSSPVRLPRKIPRAPFKVLDAPALADDFYLNLVDWSAQNVLAVGLGSCVYLWSACTSKVTRLVDFGDAGAVCSVAWSQRGSYLSVGTDRGDVQVWDPARCKRVRSMPGHKQRVGCMAWNHHTLATGSRDRAVLLRDVRSPEPHVGRLGAHRSEVCGLKWSPDDRELASGGNDNQLLVWAPPAGGGAPLHRFTAHQAAIKALAWSPHQHGLLASGGGTADRCVRFWNTSTGQALSCVDTGSQVCNLSWSKNVNEMVSTHGYSQNQIVVWRYPSMHKLATLTGHTMRVLYLAVSPDGQTIVTGAGDETLRFWNVFPGPKAQGGGGDTGVGSMMRTLIR